MTASNGRPQNETVVTSCSAQPSLAQASENDEGAGTQTVSASGTSPASALPTP